MLDFEIGLVDGGNVKKKNTGEYILLDFTLNAEY